MGSTSKCWTSEKMRKGLALLQPKLSNCIDFSGKVSGRILPASTPKVSAGKRIGYLEDGITGRVHGYVVNNHGDRFRPLRIGLFPL